MTSKNIILIDFKDSFTYNILAELIIWGGENIKVEVVDWKKISLFFRNNQKNLGVPEKEERGVVIYGPGPGHPKEYSSLFPFLADLIKRPLLFHLGICLGHQLLWSLNGVKVKRDTLTM